MAETDWEIARITEAWFSLEPMSLVCRIHRAAIETASHPRVTA